jgi:hypothetical protein
MEVGRPYVVDVFLYCLPSPAEIAYHIARFHDGALLKVLPEGEVFAKMGV